MKHVEERYISLLTDFGFKRIFGSAPNKDLLICFLNSLFNGRQVVKDVKYLNPENVGDIYTDRKAIFDVYCEGENGEKFIVEMQNAYQTYFKDRALFYSTFPIREQAPKGSDWDFKLNHVYTIALLNFNMNEDAFNKKKSAIMYSYAILPRTRFSTISWSLSTWKSPSSTNRWTNWKRSTTSGSMH